MTHKELIRLSYTTPYDFSSLKQIHDFCADIKIEQTEVGIIKILNMLQSMGLSVSDYIFMIRNEMDTFIIKTPHQFQVHYGYMIRRHIIETELICKVEEENFADAAILRDLLESTISNIIPVPKEFVYLFYDKTGASPG